MRSSQTTGFWNCSPINVRKTRFSLVHILVLTSTSICHMLINLQYFLQMPSTTLINSEIVVFLRTVIIRHCCWLSCVNVCIYREISQVISSLYPYDFRHALNSCRRGLLRRACWSMWPAPLRAARQHPPSCDSACVWPSEMGYYWIS